MDVPSRSPAREAFAGTLWMPLKITLLLVERSFLGSLKQACAEIERVHHLGLELAVHLLPDVRTTEDWQRVAADVSSSVALLAIHVTEEASARRIAELLDEQGPQLRAFVPLNCVASLMRRARLGGLDLARQSGFMSRFGKLIRRPSGERSAESFASLAGRVAGWLRFAPGRGQDFRAYLQIYGYYLNSSPENLRNMLLLILRRYAGAAVTPGPVVEYPTASIYHPDAPRQFDALDDYLAWFHSRPGAPSAGAAQVGVILFRTFVLNHNTAHYDAVIAAIERRGLIPVPALAFALDNRVIQERFFGRVQTILSLTGFGYVGGMGANDAPAAVAALGRQDVPYLDAVSLTFQRIEEWLASPTGLNPLQSMMQVAIPELDGAIEPFIFGGVTSATDGFQPLPERIERLVDRLARMVELRLKPNAEKRIAITLFSFPPNRGNLGTAAYLDVFASLQRLLTRLAGSGYAVDVPDSAEALREALAGSNASEHGTPANVAASIPVADYLRGWPYFREVEDCWGRAPGAINSNGSELFVLGRHFGNVFIGVQPSFGYEGDPLRLLAAQGQTPSHAFCAYYLYLQKLWQADAVLHFGTHGSLEFMPGKQIGLSEACWPDRLIGALPHVYLYSVGNPSEGTIAKRRGYGSLVSYLTPPMQQAGLYKELLALRDLLDTYRRTRDGALLAEIRQLAAALDLTPVAASDAPVPAGQA